MYYLQLRTPGLTWMKARPSLGIVRRRCGQNLCRKIPTRFEDGPWMGAMV